MELKKKYLKFNKRKNSKLLTVEDLKQQYINSLQENPLKGFK